MIRYYRQCHLVRELRGSASSWERITTWIPEQYAHRDNWIDLWSKEFEEWSKGWRVVEVGIRMSEDDVLDNERNYLSQRKASDI